MCFIWIGGALIWGKKAVCDLLYMGGKCFRVISVIYDDFVLKTYTVLKYDDQMIKIHCFHSSIFCIEHRLILVCGHYNYHYNEPLWANANFSILWLLIKFPICFSAIHGKYSLWFIQELKNNQILATEWPKGDLCIYVSDVWKRMY